MRERVFYVYILSSRSRRLYTGVTNDLSRRLAEHRLGLCMHTKRYQITSLVYYETTGNPIAAIAREKQIKSWTREKRLSLIETENAGWRDLSSSLVSDSAISFPPQSHTQ